ncbi:hypothetical protein OIU85_019810 [Salix viminalis]|uniref:Uncharacterized protein n=1 Tax=Salix viminalis TaxID=40686 RepID=A0A9Q0ZKI7_SALVM|nr:hypothetical protein OIU85_019810 [Salix viminalis]
MQVVLSGRRGVIHPVKHGMNRMHLQVAFMFHPYHPHHLQKLASSSNLDDCESAQNMMKNEDGGFGEFDETSNDGSFRENGVGNESKVKKVELKVGGITRTITARNFTPSLTAMARAPGKHGLDQALDFQGFLND